MLRKSILPSVSLFLIPKEKRTCMWIGNLVLLQCLIVVLVGYTILKCTWSPYLLAFDPYKLASVMYLYDKEVCELQSSHQQVVQNLQLSTDTKGFNVLPIRWEPAVVTVSARLSQKTRGYVLLSVVWHVVWALLTLIFRCIVKSNKNSRLLSIGVTVYFLLFISTNMFDLSMAIVYITHIKKALTKGMVLRHSGWSVELYIKNTDDFAGYLPIIAAACWMRGFIFLALNIYSCKKLNDIRFRLKQKMVIQRFDFLNHPLPDAVGTNQELKADTLYYRAGEKKPYVEKY